MQSDSKSNFHLVGLRREGEDTIELIWNDGRVDRWTAAKLRKRCPCATCREKQRGEAEKQDQNSFMLLPVLTAAEAAPLRVQSMEPVGGYAYRVRFSDGHGSGLYPFALLRDAFSNHED